MNFAINAIKTYTRQMYADYILQMKPRTNIPKYLIYYNRKVGCYTLFSGKTGESLGKMKARPLFVATDRVFYPDKNGYTSFYISSLKARVKRQGIGRALVNLAKVESVRKGCDGRVHLIAKNITREADNCPFVAYRKMGFDSQYKWAVESADKFIKTGTGLSPHIQRDIPMYLPLKSSKNE